MILAATLLSAGLASIFMATVARCVLAMETGKGLNAYFTYAVVQAMGVPWQTALASALGLIPHTILAIAADYSKS